MPKVRFLGTSDHAKYGDPGAAQVDDVVLVKDEDSKDVTKKQLDRLRALEGHRFEVESEKAAERQDKED